MTTFAAAFVEVPDPRQESLIDYPFMTLLAIIILSTICGAEGWQDMELWARGKSAWLSTFLDMSHGVPTADTYRRLMGAILPGPFRRAFTMWAQQLADSLANQVVAIDGKTARGSRKPSQGISAVHVVRAFAASNRIILGQVAVDCKSSELTAIPELLKMIAIKGGLVTNDAMGTHKNIAQDILDNGADYLLPVKGNQPTLRKEVQEVFEGKAEQKQNSATFYKSIEKGHGRQEERKVWIHTSLKSLATVGEWPKVQTLIHIESHRKVGEKESTIEDRYYVSSREMTAKQAADFTRSHWSVENPCHWVLDMVLREDECPIYDTYAARNMSLVRSVVLNALKTTPPPSTYDGYRKKVSIRQKRKICGWEQDYLGLIARSLF